MGTNYSKWDAWAAEQNTSSDDEEQIVDCAQKPPPPPIGGRGAPVLAVDPTFTIHVRDPNNGTTDPLPLRAQLGRDGFGKASLVVRYSLHMGLKALHKWARRMLPADDSDLDSAAKILAESEECTWCIATIPVHPPHERALLGPQDACFHIKKFEQVFEALKASGIITILPGRTHQTGYYPPFPIARINLPPLTDDFDAEESEKNMYLFKNMYGDDRKFSQEKLAQALKDWDNKHLKNKTEF